MKKLWGDNYYDPTLKKWITSDISEVSGKKLERGFVEFVMNPIINFVKAIREDD
jgi:elongation factor 2